jgi:hypothetical protein
MCEVNGLASHDHREWWIPSGYHTDSIVRGAVPRQNRARQQAGRAVSLHDLLGESI